MLRLGKLTDYGTVLMTHLARHGERRHSASELAAELGLSLPTVSKVLKALVQGGLLVSHRGAKGGYGLARPAEEISVASIVAAIEGPIALTECSQAQGSCEQEGSCEVQGNWRRINEAVQRALEEVSLADLARPEPPPARPLRYHPRQARARSGAGAG
ncbi:MAG: SUF system Fe-S cluster assembly regulator [Gammaproteobacteria bacterium]|nr:MAG: SUF system Fe-S cluster assembly regulator [Gammaproteobacteria bacterium]